MPPPLSPWRDLPPERQARLRDAYADEMTRRTTTCSLDEKITRFAAWLEPKGISFGAEDLPARKR
jgi:hypothetical protein